jgi:hypothetical protein
MNIIEGTTFHLLSDQELPALLTNARLVRCTFAACAYGSTAQTPTLRRKLKDIAMLDCRATNNSSLGPAIVEDVEVTSLSTEGLCIAWGAAYKRVHLKGACGRIMLADLPVGVHSASKISHFEEANAKFYEGVDWALDISLAEVEELDIRNVPARLIRRDPETQVVVRRERVLALREQWRGLDLAGTPWPNSLQNMLTGEAADKVLVAPKRRRDFSRWLEGLRLLQRAGVADAN